MYYVAELSVFSFVILLHIDKASEKKRNICNFSKFCVFLFIYIYIYIYMNLYMYIYVHITYNFVCHVIFILI